MKSFSRLIGCAVLFLTTGIILITLQLDARSDRASKTDEQYVVGVVATASEDEWHAMMLESILDAAAAQGFDVITLHSAHSTDAQAEQVRALIIYQVDAIVLSPVAETGWDYVFQEAHDAGIPIITVNKRASTPQEDLVSYVGYDYNAAGQDAALAYLASPGRHDGNVVELCGTVDASFTREITGGFSSGLRQMQSPLRINYSVSTEFMRSRAKKVIEWLASNSYEMDLILAHSDGITIVLWRRWRRQAEHPETRCRYTPSAAVSKCCKCSATGKSAGWPILIRSCWANRRLPRCRSACPVDSRKSDCAPCRF